MLAALRRFVRERAQLRGCSQIIRLNAGRGMKPDRHAVSQRDRPGLIQEQHVDIARRFDCAPAHCEDVALKDTVHSGDANRAEQSADRRWDQTNQQRDENGMENAAPE